MSTCTSCGQAIEWAKTYKTETAIPLDPGPAPEGTGNLLVLPTAGLVVHLKKDDARWLAGKGVELRRSHFVTCPEADQHRRRADLRRGE